MTTTKVLSNSETYEIILIMALLILAAIILINIIDKLLKNSAENKKAKNKKANTKGKKYVISATRYSSDGGSITHWHGYNSDKWIFTYEEAVAKKNKISRMFDRVVIMEYKDSMVKTAYKTSKPGKILT